MSEYGRRDAQIQTNKFALRIKLIRAHLLASGSVGQRIPFDVARDMCLRRVVDDSSDAICRGLCTGLELWQKQCRDVVVS